MRSWLNSDGLVLARWTSAIIVSVALSYASNYFAPHWQAQSDNSERIEKLTEQLAQQADRNSASIALINDKMADYRDHISDKLDEINGRLSNIEGRLQDRGKQ